MTKNHRWAMAQGERSLELELQRMHAAGERERAAIPPPPGPTFQAFVRKREMGV